MLLGSPQDRLLNIRMNVFDKNVYETTSYVGIYIRLLTC